MRAYRDLKAWQHAIDLAPEVYKLVRRLPKEENFALSNQIRRAVVSIAANIAEGQSKQNKKEFIQFLFIAKGSLAELETLLIFAEKLSYLQPADLEQIEPRIRELRMTLLRTNQSSATRRERRLASCQLPVASCQFGRLPVLSCLSCLLSDKS